MERADRPWNKVPIIVLEYRLLGPPLCEDRQAAAFTHRLADGRFRAGFVIFSGDVESDRRYCLHQTLQTDALNFVLQIRGFLCAPGPMLVLSV